MLACFEVVGCNPTVLGVSGGEGKEKGVAEGGGKTRGEVGRGVEHVSPFISPPFDVVSINGAAGVADREEYVGVAQRDGVTARDDGVVGVADRDVETGNVGNGLASVRGDLMKR